MQILVKDVKLSLDQNEADLGDVIALQLHIAPSGLKVVEIKRKSIDARRSEVFFVYTILVEIDDQVPGAKGLLENRAVSAFLSEPPLEVQPGREALQQSPVIIGTGPAGLFCGLALARAGYRPILLERGFDVDRRVSDVNDFWAAGRMDPESNVQFGEGGAGTFSDGKLTTRIGDQRVAYVLDSLVSFGAPEEIRYLKKPHIGTDRLRQVVKAARQEILARGGSVYFSARVTDFVIENGALRGLVVNDRETLETSTAVLAVGNSARDIYRKLHRHGVTLLPKGFAVGARIEHPQEMIDKVQFGASTGHAKLGAADYHMTYQDQGIGRGLYTFCMCPGGEVIAAASDHGQVVTNGMSRFQRNSGKANSALVVTVPAQDISHHPLAGVEFQEQLEALAYKAGGANYRAPSQLVTDFLENKGSSRAESSYRPGCRASNLWNVLPADICTVMARGIRSFDRKIPGFAGPDAVLIGVETRTSAPLRIERNHDMVSVSLAGLYPCGEGAGYAGGIISSAVDGLKAAEKIIEMYSLPQHTCKLDFAGIVDAASVSRLSEEAVIS